MQRLIFIACLALTACSNEDSAASVHPSGYLQRGLDKEPGLSDCKAFTVDGENLIRCPASSTSFDTKHDSGRNRTTHRSIIVDGVTYQPAKK